MGTLGDGLADGGEIPIRDDLDREAVGGVLMKKRGGRAACRGGSWSDHSPFG